MTRVPTDDRTGLGAQSIEDRIVEFVRRELLDADAPFDRDANLLTGDRIDSMGVLRLSAFVAETFGVAMRPGDFVVENFRTVGVLAGFVLRRRADGEAAS
jgi:acyl carrier protein